MLPEGLMRSPPGGNSAPLGISREGQPSGEGCCIFTLLGRCQLPRPGTDRKTNGILTRGEHEAVGINLKNHSNDNFQSFIYLRVKGQGFHWPEMPEAWLLSTTPVVILQNPYGADVAAASGKVGAI